MSSEKTWTCTSGRGFQHGILREGNPVSVDQVLEHLNRLERLEAERDQLQDLLMEARAQLEYLHEKFKPTGTGEAVLARLRAALSGPPPGFRLIAQLQRRVSELEEALAQRQPPPGKYAYVADKRRREAEQGRDLVRRAYCQRLWEINDLAKALRALMPENTGYGNSMDWQVYSRAVKAARELLEQLEANHEQD